MSEKKEPFFSKLEPKQSKLSPPTSSSTLRKDRIDVEEDDQIASTYKIVRSIFYASDTIESKILLCTNFDIVSIQSFLRVEDIHKIVAKYYLADIFMFFI
jgi:hypothetical protein